MNTLNRVVLLASLFVIASCGGGGGGGGDDYDAPPVSSNTGPEITNTEFNITVQENQTTAFQIFARDYDGDTLTYSLSGTDSALMSVSSSGLVTFNTAPDFEILLIQTQTTFTWLLQMFRTVRLLHLLIFLSL